MKRLPCFLIATALCIAIPWSAALAKAKAGDKIASTDDIVINNPGQGVLDPVDPGTIPNLVTDKPGLEVMSPVDPGKFKINKCGNGKRDPGEQCDSSCTVNPDCNLCSLAGPNYICHPESCMCVSCIDCDNPQTKPICGDGMVSGNEMCDINNDCPSTSNVLQKCNLTTCQCEDVDLSQPCGNHIWDFNKGEPCEKTLPPDYHAPSGLMQCSGTLTATNKCTDDCKCPMMQFPKCDCATWTGSCPSGQHCVSWTGACMCKPDYSIPECAQGSECKVDSDCKDPTKSQCVNCSCVGWPVLPCGNGTIDQGEQCDPPGKKCKNGTDDCNAQCQCVPPAQPQCDMNAQTIPPGANWICTNNVPCKDPNQSCDGCFCVTNLLVKPQCDMAAQSIPPGANWQCTSNVKCTGANQSCNNCLCETNITVIPICDMAAQSIPPGANWQCTSKVKCTGANQSCNNCLCETNITVIPICNMAAQSIPPGANWQCTNNVKCPAGNSCVACNCIPDDNLIPFCDMNAQQAAQGFECTNVQKCNAGSHCVSCMCVPDPTKPLCMDELFPDPGKCSNHKACASGFKCESCNCVPELSDCDMNAAQVPTGYECTNNVSCGLNKHCVDCKCWPDVIKPKCELDHNPPAGKCSLFKSCSSGYHCVNCDCIKDPAPQCDMNALQIPPGATWQCTSKVACPAGQGCDNCMCAPLCGNGSVQPGEECDYMQVPFDFTNCPLLIKPFAKDCSDKCKCLGMPPPDIANQCKPDGIFDPATEECDPLIQSPNNGSCETKPGYQCDQLTCKCTPICYQDILDPNDKLNSTCSSDLFCQQNQIGSTCDTTGSPPTCKCKSICDMNNQPMPLSDIECSNAQPKCPNWFEHCDGCKCIADLCPNDKIDGNEACDMGQLVPGTQAYQTVLQKFCPPDPAKGIAMSCDNCDCNYVQLSCMDKIGVLHPNCSSTDKCWPGEYCDSLCRCVPDQNLCAGQANPECTKSAECDDGEFCDMSKCECEDLPEIVKIPEEVETHLAESFQVPYDDCMIYPLTFSSDEVAEFYKEANAKVQAAIRRTDSPMVEAEQWFIFICRFNDATIPQLKNPASAQQIKAFKGNPLSNAVDNLRPFIIIQDSGSKLLDVQKFMNYTQLTEPLQLLPIAGTADAQVVKGMMVDLASSLPQGVVPMTDASVTVENGNIDINHAFRHDVFSISPEQTYTISTAGGPSAQIVAKAEDLLPGAGVAVHVSQAFAQPVGAPFTAPEGYEGLENIELRKRSLPDLIAELQSKLPAEGTPPSEIYANVTAWQPNLNYQFTVIQGVYTSADAAAQTTGQKSMSLKAVPVGPNNMAMKKQIAGFANLQLSEDIGGGCKCSVTNAAATAGNAVPLVLLLLAPVAGMFVRRKKGGR